MVETGLADAISVVDSNGSGSEIVNKFGILVGAQHSQSQDVTQKSSIGLQPRVQENLDGVAEISGQITSNPPNLQVLEIFGTFTDNGDDTYTVEPDENLPVFEMEQQKIDGGGVATLEGFKFGSFSLSVQEDQELELEVSGMGDGFEFDDTATISQSQPDGSPRRFFDCKVKMDGTVVGSVDTATLDFNRDLEAFKGIEDDAAGEKRTPTELIEKMFGLSFNIVINIEDATAYEKALDDAGNPYTIQDERSDITISIVIDTDAGTDEITYTGARAEEVSADMANDVEKRTATVSGVAQDWDVDGDL